MKLFPNLIIIYISSLLISQSFSQDEISNPLYQLCLKLHNNNEDICKAIFYLAPSYFALVISEIIPEPKKLVHVLSNSPCLKNYFEKNDTEKIEALVKYSSKSFPDFGDEEGCVNPESNNTFFLYTIEYYTSNSSKYKGKFKLLPFISKGYSFFGLCLENSTECKKDLPELISIIKTGSLNGLDDANISLFMHNSTDSSTNEIEDINSISIYYLILIIYVVFRIIVWIFGYYFFKEKDDNISNKKDDNDSSSSEEEEEEEDEEDQSNSQENPKELKGEQKIELIQKKEKIIEIPKKEIYPKLFYFYKICSISKSFKHLVIIEGNELFNEKDLYLIIFFRFLALLLKVFHFNFNYYIHNPSKEINNTNIFKDVIMILINISAFSDVIFILTESIIVSYKLMSFLRKYADKDEGPSFPLFLNFFIRIIPTMTTVILSFVLFYFKYNLIIYPFYLMGIDLFSTKIQHMKKNILNSHSCLNCAKNFIPFYMHYHNIIFKTNTNNSCFQFMLIFVNMFYCYCLCLLLTYIAFKIKNKIYDIILSILFLIYYVIPNNLFCESLEYFNINIILGEICSITKTHLFIKYYFLGFLIGFAFFYNNDITTDNSLQNSNMYKPFYYLKDLIGCFFKLAKWKHIIIIIAILIIFVILSIYSFFYTSFSLIDYYHEPKVDNFVSFLYLNDKTAFAVSFGFFLIILYTYKSESNLKEFGNNIFIIFFHRIGYDFYCYIEIMIYIIYSVIGFNYSLTGQNLAFASIGIIFYIILSSAINNILLYIPVKHCLNIVAHCRGS